MINSHCTYHQSYCGQYRITAQQIKPVMNIDYKQILKSGWKGSSGDTVFGNEICVCQQRENVYILGETEDIKDDVPDLIELT